MKNLIKTGLLMALAFALLLAIGCDEDDPAGPADKQIGDVNNPAFQQLMASMETSELYTGMLLDDIFDVLDAVFEEAAPGVSGDRSHPFAVTGIEADSVSLVYHATSQYWFWYLHSESGTALDTLAMTIIDSVQFLHADGPVQWPDSTLLTGIHTGAFLEMVSGADNEIEASQLLTVMGDIVNRGDITLNGAQSIDLLFVADSCTVTMDMSTTATEVVVNLAHVDTAGCPESGAFQHQGTVGIECTGQGALNFNDTWTVVQTFTGDDMFAIVAENSTTRWTYSGSCLGDE